MRSTTARVRPSRTPTGDLLAQLPHQLRPALMPAQLEPMLCTLIAAPFDHQRWIFEPKYDGLRVLAHFDGRELALLSRNGASQNFQFPDVVAALRDSLTRPGIVDGEVVCLDEHDRSSFRALQQRFHLTNTREVAVRMRQHPASLYLFDLLYVDGYDVRSLPLKDRKALLREAVHWSHRVLWTPSQVEQGTALWQQACHEGAEGIIGKHLDRPYIEGRSPWWVKIKCVGRQEFVVGGFTDPQRSRVGLGALLIGYYSDDGQRLIYAGKVGTGYTREVLLDLRARLDALEQRVSPFDAGDLPHGSQVHWVTPQLVAEIAFHEWTQNGILRQPRFEGLRTDKSPRECRRERPQTRRPPAAPRRDKTPTENTPGWNARNRQSGPLAPGETTMALETYQDKRDFAKTPEPPPLAKRKRTRNRPMFVVQEHHASRLHYDFRLEADGVLKSWAVPKGPSMDPAQKRLAVQVEDHPLDYATFTGTIPEGLYGAGRVSIWDQGTYDNVLADKPAPHTVTEGIDAGHLEFTLHGKKLQGRFALIRMRGNGRGKAQWLLIKMQDARAQSEKPIGKDVRRPESTSPTTSHANHAASAQARRPTRARRPSKPSEAGITYTHTEKLMDPESGITKGDVLEFYRRMAPHLLPYLRDRPATLERLPEGLNGPDAPHFWQKRTPDYYPDWIERVELPSERGEAVPYVLVNDEATLLYLVNQGTLTFHVGCSRIVDLERPDFVLFDLDPGRASFADVVAVAKTLHGVLRDEGREAFVKTSGKTGLHVFAPWLRQTEYDEARAWALGIAQRVVDALPGHATIERSKAKRGKRVYVDVMQNAKGHHAVPPYVLRAVPGAPVSTPLRWQELTAHLDPKAFNLKTIVQRLARQRHDPMAGLLRGVVRSR
jgi:bifunctional non-homologous end joining protein LigD